LELCMSSHGIWRRITTSRRARELEAAAQRESALREEFARRTHALEAQILLLRAENRALLNSVLGIAGIPPVIVAEPPAPAGEPAPGGKPDLASVGASAAADCADVDACLDAVHPAAAPPSHGRHSEERSDEEPLFVSPGCLGAKSKRDPSASIRLTPQDDGAVDESVAPNGSASPSPPRRTGHSGAVPLPNQSHSAFTPLATNTVLPQKQSRRARLGNAVPVIAPIRRRSWHQIYRMLEFESSRRKDREP
jgi:hypothetical protein